MKHAVIIPLLSVLVSFLYLAQASDPQRHPLLSREDIEYVQRDRARGSVLSGMSGPAGPWQSYNEWVCADAVSSALEDETVNYDGEEKHMPHFLVKLTGYQMDFCLSADVRYDFVEIKRRWQELISGATHVCFYGAFLPVVTDWRGNPYNAWVLAGLKTDRGYWWESDETSLPPVNGDEDGADEEPGDYEGEGGIDGDSATDDSIEDH